MSSNMGSFIWPAHFACTVITENIILPCSYTINVSLEPGGPKSNINLGFKKLRVFVDNQLHNSVFVYKDSVLASSISETKNNTVLFPSEPYDYVVGSTLLSKFIAITEKYFEIGYITIESTIGDHIQYTITDLDDAGFDTDESSWWGSDSPNTGLNNDTSWESLNLSDNGNFSPVVIKGGLEK